MAGRWWTLLLWCSACAPVAPAPRADRAVVWLFVATDCPISNSYAPEMARIAREYAGPGIRVRYVYPDPDTSPAAARAHAAAYGLRGEIVPDPTQALARRLGVTITPEAALELPDGTIAYRGRIDDRWAGWQRQRPAPRRRDLRAALEAILAGRAVPHPRTVAVGCDLPDPPPEDR